MVAGIHLLDLEINKEMVQKRDFSVLLEELSGRLVIVVSQPHQEGNHLVSQGDVTVIRGSPANMEEDIHAVQGVKVGTFLQGPQLLIRVTTKTTVAGLDTQPPTNRLVYVAEVPIVPVIVDCTDIGVVIRVKNVEKCTKLQLTDNEAPRFQDLVGLIESADMKVL